MPRTPDADTPEPESPAVEAPAAAVNDLPFDALVHVGGGRYEHVPIGAPWPAQG